MVMKEPEMTARRCVMMKMLDVCSDVELDPNRYRQSLILTKDFEEVMENL